VAARGLRLERTLGPQVVAWIEANLVHGPGDVQGQRLELDDEQVRFLLRCYELDDQGRRLVRRAVYMRPKGRAKTELAAAVACAEAIGPVRFAGWGEDGKPVGRPVVSPYVRLAATEEGQAGNTYEAVRVMLTEGPLARTGLDVGLTRTYLPCGGKLVPVTAAAASKEGGKETFAVFDETGLYVLPELHRMYETIRRNLAKRKQAEPWSLETSAMYALGEESVAEHSHRYAQAIAEGQIEDPGFLFDYRRAPDGFDFRNPAELRAALAEVYGAAAEWMDLERLVAEAYDPQTREDAFRRFFLNQAVARSTHWLSPVAWAACADPGYQAPEGTRVVLGFDGSYRLDSSALVAATVEERPYLWLIGLWERPERAPDDWVVDREQVDATVHKAMQAFDVAELAFDPPGWHHEADRWADSYGAETVVEFPTSSRSRVAPACSRFYSAVMGGLLAHDGDPRLSRHIANAVLKDTTAGGYITKDGPNSPRKIDAAIAAVIAHERACWHRANPGPAPFDPDNLFMWA
jgi:phage terminase large subunit-like protein